MEVNPFTGKPFFNEVIFYHRSSKSLLTTDLFWNYPQPDGIPNSHLPITNEETNPPFSWELAPPVDSIPIGSRLWKFGMDRIYKPFYKNFMIQDRTEYERMAEQLLNGTWSDVETVIPAHGDLIHGAPLIQDVLREHFL